MARIQTLCEFLADNGGLRSFRNHLDTVGASDLRNIGAQNWHKTFKTHDDRMDAVNEFFANAMEMV